MKKFVLIIIVFVGMFSFQSCTDNTEENLVVKHEKMSFTEPGDDGTEDDDQQETGEKVKN